MNEDELVDLVNFALSVDGEMRFIEQMPSMPGTSGPARRWSPARRSSNVSRAFELTEAWPRRGARGEVPHQRRPGDHRRHPFGHPPLLRGVTECGSPLTARSVTAVRAHRVRSARCSVPAGVMMISPNFFTNRSPASFRARNQRSGLPATRPTDVGDRWLTPREDVKNAKVG